MRQSTFVIAVTVVAMASLHDASADPAPWVVQQQAQSYAATHRDTPRPRNGGTIADEYARWFFQGFTHQGGVQTKIDLIATAYGAGQTYWRDHPEKRDEVLAGYGYTRVARDGVVSMGFERSSFTPLDVPSEHWWFSSFGGRRWSELRPDQKEPEDGARMRVEGYLSSPGRFGHLGAYERELLVTSFGPLQS